MIVEAIDTTQSSLPSRSLRACTAVSTRSQVPSFAHRSNRLNTVFHAPNRSGTSRHGDPVRNRHATASTTNRWSIHGRDRPVVRGSNGSITAHASSETTSRSCTTSASPKAAENVLINTP